MDSSSGKRRRRSKKHRAGGASGLVQPHKSKRSQTTTSFTPPPPSSRGTLRLPEARKPRPTYKAFLAAFLGVFLLVFLGGSHNNVVLGTALILPGIALLIKPPTSGLGKLGDIGVLGLLACLLLAFLPQFYWPTADWRVDAVEAFGIQLPAVLSIQPRISFEAWIMAVAGFAWLYAALQWRVNLPGRRRLFFWLSILLAATAGIVVWGNLVGARYPGAESATAFSFFPNRNQTANFLALGGVATFAYAMEGIRTRALKPLIGVPATALCLAGLVLGVSRAGVALYFIGVGLWFLLSLRAHSMPRFFKIGFPVIVVALSLVVSSNQQTVQRIISFVSSDSEMRDDFRLKIYEDASKMVMDAPLTGFGLGNFPAIFPQYREASANHQRVVHPESDFFWIATEGGLIAVGFLGLILFAYARLCRGFSQGMSASFRVLALAAVLIFLIHGLVDVPGHRPGTAYFAILFAALALPNRELPVTSLPPVFWRALGCGLLFVGLAWSLTGAFRLPWHSSLRMSQFEEAIRTHVDVADFKQARALVDDWIALRPLDWRAYFQRAQLTLADSGSRSEAAADFRRARFVEPIIGVVSFEEGKVWLPYDAARAVSAWRLTLFRELEGKDRYFRRMLGYAKNSPENMERMARLSEIDPYYRAYLLRYIAGDELMREISIELAKDPGLSDFSREQRTGIVRNWVKRGDLDSAADFMAEHGDSLENMWWLWSLLHKGRTDYIKAVDTIRASVEVPGIPEVQLDEAVMARLMREYAVAPNDIVKGTALLHVYLKEEAYEKALPILDRLLESHKPPSYLYYWRAECLYHVEDYIESWFAFETYLEELWQEE